MRTLGDIRASGRALPVSAAMVVLLLALIALVQPDGETAPWLGDTGIAALLACAAGVMAVAIGSPRLATAFAIAAFSAGTATFDHYQIVGPGRVSDAHGLLSQVLAVATLLAGVAIAAAAWLRKPRRRAITVVSFGSIIVALGIAGLIHDLFPGFEATALPADEALWRALMLVVLGVAVVSVGRPRGTRGRLTRWLFVPLALAVAAGALLLAQLVRVQEVRQVEVTTATTLERFGDRLRGRLVGSVSGLERMARQWNWLGPPERAAWEAEARLFVNHFPEVRSAARIDEDMQVLWIVPEGERDRLPARRLGRLAPAAAALESAVQRQRPAMSEPLVEDGQLWGFLVAVPVASNNRFGGYLAGFYRLHQLFAGLQGDVAPGYVVTVGNDGEQMYRSHGASTQGLQKWRREAVFEAYGADWEMSIAPTRETIDRRLSALPSLTLAIGLAIALLVGIAVYQAEAARLSARRLGAAVERRARVEEELRRYQGELERRVDERTEELQAKQTELERSNTELERLATTDGLTGISNRRSFMQVAEREFAAVQRYGRSLALIMFDLDHFKEVNDRHGHQCGDVVLAAAAEEAGTGLRGTDCIGRYGGEEFAILLPESGRAEAEAVAERIRANLERLRFDCDVEDLSITASFGITTVKATDAGIDPALERVDRALYAAKATGRNRIVYLDE